MSYYDATGPLDAAARRDPLETAASLALGRLLVAASRLDLALQLYVSALPASGGAASGLHGNLGKLLAYADALPHKQLRADFVSWIVRTREAAPLVDDLRHARWLPDPRRNVVLVLGTAGHEAAQRSCSVEELEAALAFHRGLIAELHRLCMQDRGLTPANAAAFLTTQPIGVAEEMG